MLDDGRLDRAAGVLLGTAAGDALGAGYEFTRPGPEQEIDMIGGGAFDWAPGEWTDDTAMALAIAQAAADGPGLEIDAVAAGFVRWYDSDPKISASRPTGCSPRDRPRRGPCTSRPCRWTG